MPSFWRKSHSFLSVVFRAAFQEWHSPFRRRFTPHLRCWFFKKGRWWWWWCQLVFGRSRNLEFGIWSFGASQVSYSKPISARSEWIFDQKAGIAVIDLAPHIGQQSKRTMHWRTGPVDAVKWRQSPRRSGSPPRGEIPSAIFGPCVWGSAKHDALQVGR